MHQSTFRRNYVLIAILLFLNFCAENYLLISFNLNSFNINTFGILSYEIKHKEGICKVLGRSAAFSIFGISCKFLSLPQIVINTTLSKYLPESKIQLFKSSLV